MDPGNVRPIWRRIHANLAGKDNKLWTAIVQEQKLLEVSIFLIRKFYRFSQNVSFISAFFYYFTDSFNNNFPNFSVHTKTVVVAVGSVIRYCKADGKQYPVGDPFSFNEGCFRFNCECYSDGSWECPSERSEYICSHQTGQIIKGKSLLFII